MPSLNDAVRAWHDVYALIGTSAATLVGLMFVAASVGTGVYSRDRQHALRVFLSPTVVHFSSALTASLFAIAPLRSWQVFGVLIGADGLFGLGYTTLVWLGLLRRGMAQPIDLDDRAWYALFPAIAYGAMIAAGVVLMRGQEGGCTLLAVAMAALLLVGIRNAWDMTMFTIMRHRD